LEDLLLKRRLRLRNIRVYELLDKIKRTDITYVQKVFFIENILKIDNEFFTHRKPNTTSTDAEYNRLRRILKTNERILRKMEALKCTPSEAIYYTKIDKGH